MSDLNNGEWMCNKCRKVWKDSDYNIIALCDSCIVKREYLLKSGGRI
jgi:hypothetical protein